LAWQRLKFSPVPQKHLAFCDVYFIARLRKSLSFSFSKSEHCGRRGGIDGDLAYAGKRIPDSIQLGRGGEELLDKRIIGGSCSDIVPGHSLVVEIVNRMIVR
jgi:hypothetical protein